MCSRYITTYNLVTKVPQKIRLCEGVLNQMPGTQSNIKSVKVIQTKAQYMTEKCQTVRHLDLPRQHIM